METTIIPVARETTDRRMTETMTEAGREIITVIREIETITIVRGLYQRPIALKQRQAGIDSRPVAALQAADYR